jgi:hypothetical protein
MKKNKNLFETKKRKDEYMIDMRYFYNNPTWIFENVPVDEYLTEIKFNLKELK